ncbi:MAG: hypothetical protein RBS43_09130 [Candidatus Cloacimonas sp.]|nr:hypothetical protein [Candidatus Cloacimonas sp.]
MELIIGSTLYLCAGKQRDIGVYFTKSKRVKEGKRERGDVMGYTIISYTDLLFMIVVTSEDDFLTTEKSREKQRNIHENCVFAADNEDLLI